MNEDVQSCFGRCALRDMRRRFTQAKKLQFSMVLFILKNYVYE